MAQIRVYIRNAVGGSRSHVELPDNVPMYELLPVLVERLGLPAKTKFGPPIEYAIDNLRTNRRLDVEETMSSADVQQDDELVLLPEVNASLPVRTIKDIQYAVPAITSWNGLFAIILYTKQDKSLASYIRKNLDELNYMSGTKCLVFILEKPTKDTKRQIKELAQDNAENIWTHLNLDKQHPFDKNQAYNIGEYFGVMPSQFPCIVFFRGLSSQEVLVVEINDFVKPSEEISESMYVSFFRMLFSTVYRATIKPSANWLSELGKLLTKNRKIITKGQYKPLEVMGLTKSLIEIIGTVVKTFF